MAVIMAVVPGLKVVWLGLMRTVPALVGFSVTVSVGRFGYGFGDGVGAGVGLGCVGIVHVAVMLLIGRP